MIKIKYDSENPHKLVSQIGEIKEDINIRTLWNTENGTKNESGDMQLLVQFQIWRTKEYDKSGKTSNKRVLIDQFNMKNFRIFITDITNPVSTFAGEKTMINEFLVKQMIEVYNIPSNLIEIL